VLSAKDSKTARGVYRRTAFYFVGRFALPGLWGAAAFVYYWSLGGLPEGVDDLTAMPAYLNTILPLGVLGIVIAAMLAAEMSTDSGYLLTWATVIYNDLITPCFRRPLPQWVKLLIVRLLVLAIGVFLVFYGLWYQLPGAAWDYLAVTGNIYLASVFTLLVGALYWRKANHWGALAALVLGAIGPISFLIVNAVVEEDSPYRIAPELAGLSAFALAFGGMIFGSLLGRALGRGEETPEPDAPTTEEE
jgi:SSS family solute:Na+ symporter